MKHKLVVIIGLVVIVALSVVCVKSYHNDQYLLNVHDKAQQAVQRHNAKVAQAKQQAVVNQLEDECHSDHVTYLAMTPADRIKYQAQDCDTSLELVQ